MRRYRLFLVDVLGRVQQELPFEASNDDEAKRIAEDLRADQLAELWNTHARIARWSWHENRS
jgi:hypothetical protein